MKRIFSVALVFLTFVVASGCSTLNNGLGGVLNLDTDLNIHFSAAADMNPDEHQVPSPLFVRMYELKSDKVFDKANFIDLYERDSELVGADLVAKHELHRLVPGEDRVEHFVLDPETRYVALFAEFFNYSDAEFKVIIPVTQNNVVRNAAHITITENSLHQQQ